MPALLLVLLNDIIAITSHHVHGQMDKQTDRKSNYLIPINVHYVQLGGAALFHQSVTCNSMA